MYASKRINLPALTPVPGAQAIRTDPAFGAFKRWHAAQSGAPLDTLSGYTLAQEWGEFRRNWDSWGAEKQAIEIGGGE